ncbi:MAG: hypothetical protein VYE40_14970 [Myxococcota bacterium]|nr:hypothetical protein [Myxococcota bacterium]
MEQHDPYNHYNEHHYNQTHTPNWQQPGYAPTTVERSTAVSLIGFFYLGTCGLGVLQGALGLLLSLIDMNGFGIFGSFFGLAINGFIAYAGLALYRRENWARQTIIALNYLNIVVSIICTLAFFGFVLSTGFAGEAALGGIMLFFLVVFLVAIGISIAIAWFIINKLESEAVVRECTPTSIFNEDHYHHTFE